jgi:hypothetical protein
MNGDYDDDDDPDNALARRSETRMFWETRAESLSQ